MSWRFICETKLRLGDFGVRKNPDRAKQACFQGSRIFTPAGSRGTLLPQDASSRARYGGSRAIVLRRRRRSGSPETLLDLPVSGGAVPVSSGVVTPLTDQLLVESCLKGDEHAWRQLIERYKNLIYSFPPSTW